MLFLLFIQYDFYIATITSENMQCCIFQVVVLCSDAYFMMMFYASVNFSHQKDRYQRIQRRQAAFLVSLIFLNCCKPRSFYFSMLRLRLTLFPLLFNCCKPCSLFIFLRCICRPALSLIVCLYKSSSSTAAAVLQAIFLFFL